MLLRGCQQNLPLLSLFRCNHYPLRLSQSILPVRCCNNYLDFALGRGTKALGGIQKQRRTSLVGWALPTLRQISQKYGVIFRQALTPYRKSFLAISQIEHYFKLHVRDSSRATTVDVRQHPSNGGIDR